MTSDAIEVKGLNAKIGRFSLKNISFNLEKGTVMGLVGKNGAGKTSLIKTMLNILPRRSGEVLFDGLPMNGNEKIVKAKIGVVYDELIIPRNLNPLKVKDLISPFYETFGK